MNDGTRRCNHGFSLTEVEVLKDGEVWIQPTNTTCANCPKHPRLPFKPGTDPMEGKV